MKKIPQFCGIFLFSMQQNRRKNSLNICKEIFSKTGVLFLKKLIVLAAVIILLSGCSEKPEEIVLENPEQEEIQTEIPETDYIWENFIEEMAKHGYTREEIESLAEYGFTAEEITAMDWIDVVRGLGMVEYGFEKEEVESALEILENGTAKDDETFVLSGDNTDRFELIEDFVSKVKRNESAFVHGTMAGNPLYFYFELSFEPGEAIKYREISEFRVFKTEFAEIYDNEAFTSFVNEEGESFSLPKIELWPGKQLKYSKNQDIPGMPVTLDAAKKEARKIMLSANGYARFPGNEGKKLFGSYCAVLTEDYSEYADLYFEKLKPECEGIFDIAGKPYYLIYFYDGETFVGEGYYICAEKSSVAFGVSMVDGRLMPIEYFPEPKISG